MDVVAGEEQRSGLPVVDPMEAVRRAFVGQDFAIDVVSRAFGRPDPPAERSQQQESSACGPHGRQDPENRAPTVDPRPDGAPVTSEHAGNSSAQQGASTSGIHMPCTSENHENSEAANNSGGAQTTPEDAGNGAAPGWNRRVRLGRVPDERETPAGHVSALEKALTGFAERQTDAVVYPTIGTSYDSLVEAYDFYNLHSWEMGFGVRYGKSRLNAMRSKCMQEIVCGRSGKPTFDKQNKTKSVRCNCTARIRLLRSADKGWYVAHHREAHNHALSKACSDKLSWSSHKHIDKYTRDLVHKLRNNNVDLGVYNTLAAFFGRNENGPVTKGSIRTLCAKINQEQADDAVRKNVEITTALGEYDPENQATEEAPLNCFDETSSSPDCIEMPVNLLSQLDQDDTERNPDAERVADLMLTFGDCDLVLKTCSYDDLINSNSTMADLEKAMNAVKPHLQQGIFGDLWSRAHNSGGVMSAQVLTLKDLFRFERWFSTTTGKHNLQSVQQHIKLIKSGKGVFEPEQTALLRLFQAEKDEHSREISKLQGERDAKISHYQAMIDEARSSFQASVEVSKVGYPVSASYVPLSTHELRGQCWSAYLAYCQESKYMNRGASNIVERFGPEIQQRHLFEFCSQEANRQSLLKYGQIKVEKLKEAGVAHGETTFRGYMTLLDIEQAYALLAAEAQVAEDPGTSGGGQEEDNSNRENGVSRGENARGNREESGGEDASDAPQKKRLRHSQSHDLW
uniref:Uncharacterized protein n=2 Tax=Avena sativa TaxID=4498 RepID=A0ACD5X7V8_AVESA